MYRLVLALMVSSISTIHLLSHLGQGLHRTWNVTHVRAGKAIYSDYPERFWQAFPAEVHFVFNYDVVMKALIVIKPIFDVLPK